MPKTSAIIGLCGGLLASVAAATDQCADILPKTVPPPSIYTTEQLSAAFFACGTGTTDGQGDLLLPYRTNEAQGDVALVDSKGTLFQHQIFAGSLDSVDAVVPLSTGGLVLDTSSNLALNSYRVSQMVPDGTRVVDGDLGWLSLASNQRGTAIARGVTETTTGNHPSSFIESFALGQIGWRFPAPGDTTVAFGVDSSGWTLLLFSRNGSSNVLGQWLDPTGLAGPEFSVSMAKYQTWELFPRVGGGFFLRQAVPRSGYVPATWNWIAQVDSQATNFGPPPAWLLQRPNTRI